MPALTPTQDLLLVLLVIFAAPYLAWRLAGPARVPLVVVQIVGGVLLGPGVLGALAPAVYGRVFTPAAIGAVNAVASWAVMLFVWAAGLELDLAEARRNWRETTGTAGLALLAPLLLGAAAALVLFREPGWRGPHGAVWQATLGMGMACAVTALPILVLFLEDLDILQRPLGRRALRYASLDDVAIWAVLALVVADAARAATQLAFALGFLVAIWAVRRWMPRLGARDRWAAGLVWLLGCSLAADMAGLHFMVGAFLSGAVLDMEGFGRDRVAQFRGTVLMVLMPVFFLSTGLRTHWSLGGLTVFAAAGLLLVAAVGGKLAGVGLAGRLLGWGRGEASLIGWLLQTKALVMIIFANVLLDRGVISADAFTALLMMALASTVLTIPVVRRALGRAPHLADAEVLRKRAVAR
jgi:Kef-type K+ transport system membrane component KefB